MTDAIAEFRQAIRAGNLAQLQTLCVPLRDKQNIAQGALRIVFIHACQLLRDFETASYHLRRSEQQHYVPSDDETLLDAARCYNAMGCYASGMKLMASFLAETPFHEEILMLYAQTGLMLNRLFAVEQRLREALAFHPDAAKLWMSLGGTYLRKGDVAEALQAYKTAHTLDKTMAHARYGLNLAHYYSGDTQQALDAAREEMLAAKADDAEPLLQYCELLQLDNQTSAAYELVEKALILSPDSLPLLRRKAELLQTSGKPQQALAILYACFEKYTSEALAVQIIQLELAMGNEGKANKLISQALFRYPQSASLLIARGEVNRQKEDNEWYESDLRNALAFHPFNAEAHTKLGRLLEERADYHGALKHYDKAAEGSPTACIRQSYITPYDQWDKLFAEMAAVANNVRMPEKPRAEAALALARYHDAQAEWNAAWQWAELGNTLLAKGNDKADGHTLNHAEEVSRYYRQHPVPDRPLELPKGIGRIFVLGLPAQGTRILEALLHTHKAIASDGDSYMIKKCIDRLPAALQSDQPFPACMQAWDGSLTQTIQNSWRFQSSKHITNDTQVILDTSPVNSLYVDVLYQLFPTARFIYLTRPQEDIILNSYMSYSEDNAPLMRLTHNHTALPQMVSLLQDTVTHFRQTHGQAAFLDVPFRSLIDNPHAILETVLEWLELDAGAAPDTAITLPSLPLTGADWHRVGADAPDYRTGHVSHYPAMTVHGKYKVEAA